MILDTCSRANEISVMEHCDLAVRAVLAGGRGAGPPCLSFRGEPLQLPRTENHTNPVVLEGGQEGILG